MLPLAFFKFYPSLFGIHVKVTLLMRRRVLHLFPHGVHGVTTTERHHVPTVLKDMRRKFGIQRLKISGHDRGHMRTHQRLDCRTGGFHLDKVDKFFLLLCYFLCQHHHVDSVTTRHRGRNQDPPPQPHSFFSVAKKFFIA